MRILLFHPWIKSKGGAEKLVLEYIKRSKHDITVLTWMYSPENTFQEYKEFDIISIYPSSFDKLTREFLLRGLFFGLFATRRKIPINWNKYDAMLISTGGIAELILLYNKIPIPKVLYVHSPLRANYLYDIWFSFKYRYNSKIKGTLMKECYKAGIFLYSWMEKEAWKKADATVFNSKLSMKRAVDKGILMSTHKTTVIYPGVDVDYLKNMGEENYFLYVARFGAAKRQICLLKAWKLFVKKYHQYELKLVGGSENRRYLRTVLQYVRKIPKVTIRISVPFQELIDLYANCICSVQTPYMEDFGIAIIEGMAAGKFVIAPNVCGVYEIVKDAPGVKWVKEGYREDVMTRRIYDALVDFVEHEDEYVERGRKNSEFIRNLDLSWDNFAKQLDSFIEAV